MRLARLLSVAALVLAPMLARSASAGPCDTAYRLPANTSVTVCVAENDCLLYQDSSSDLYLQTPICLG
jgi:hypothetical protein